MPHVGGTQPGLSPVLPRSPIRAQRAGASVDFMGCGAGCAMRPVQPGAPTHPSELRGLGRGAHGGVQEVERRCRRRAARVERERVPRRGPRRGQRRPRGAGQGRERGAEPGRREGEDLGVRAERAAVGAAEDQSVCAARGRPRVAVAAGRAGGRGAAEGLATGGGGLGRGGAGRLEGGGGAGRGPAPVRGAAGAEAVCRYGGCSAGGGGREPWLRSAPLLAAPAGLCRAASEIEGERNRVPGNEYPPATRPPLLRQLRGQVATDAKWAPSTYTCRCCHGRGDARVRRPLCVCTVQRWREEVQDAGIRQVGGGRVGGAQGSCAGRKRQLLRIANLWRHIGPHLRAVVPVC